VNEIDFSQLPPSLTVRTAANILRVSPERLLRALKAGQLPSIQIGARRLTARATPERAKRVWRKWGLSKRLH
jgi:excisionase family DNA binding protein